MKRLTHGVLLPLLPVIVISVLQQDRASQALDEGGLPHES